MANENNPNGDSSQPAKGSAKIECSECKTLLLLPDPPPYKVLNSVDMSVVVMDHPEPLICHHCGAGFCIQINAQSSMLDLGMRKFKESDRKIINPYDLGTLSRKPH